MKEHHYTIKMEWTGNQGQGTINYRSYNRSHIISEEGKAHQIQGSSDPSFRGDKSKYNPEELFLSSISSCHMLWFLHLCSVNKIVVIDYIDHPTGTMTEAKDGSGYFKSATLHPKVTIKQEDKIERANELHHQANKMCFIANSCNFPIQHEPVTMVSRQS